MNRLACIALLALVFASCTKGTNERYLILKIKFDPTEERLDDSGLVVTNFPSGVGKLTPKYNSIAAQYIELSSDSTTPYGAGTPLFPLFKSISHTDTSGHIAVDYGSLEMVGDGEAVLSIPLSSVKPGTYQFLRFSIAAQNFDIPYKLDTTISNFIYNGINYPGGYFSGLYNATIATFSSDSTYFKDGYSIKYYLNNNVKDAIKRQGYWGFETNIGTNSIYYPAAVTTATQQEASSVNVLYRKSPTPSSFSVFTAAVNGIKYSKNGMTPPTIAPMPLTITGTETESIVIECALFTKNSFEWNDNFSGDNQWNNPFPFPKESIIDMGIRGMKPVVINK
ncbi:MAG: hypothetical protein NTZ59_04600 [Bacteroidetes bacterium]|nr:hypothetical protein [Bacteroidota bacterium]